MSLTKTNFYKLVNDRVLEKFSSRVGSVTWRFFTRDDMRAVFLTTFCKN